MPCCGLILSALGGGGTQHSPFSGSSSNPPSSKETRPSLSRYGTHSHLDLVFCSQDPGLGKISACGKLPSLRLFSTENRQTSQDGHESSPVHLISGLAHVSSVAVQDPSDPHSSGSPWYLLFFTAQLDPSVVHVGATILAPPHQKILSDVT